MRKSLSKSAWSKFATLCAQIKSKIFLNVSLSRNIVAERVCELSANLPKQLIKKEKDFIAYSLAMDESSGTFDTTQRSIFIREVYSSLCVTEKLLGLKSMPGTTTRKISMKRYPNI